jgi:hypothetical protein
VLQGGLGRSETSKYGFLKTAPSHFAAEIVFPEIMKIIQFMSSYQSQKLLFWVASRQASVLLRA